MKVCIYARVSTADQTVDNQLLELKAWAVRAGHEVVATYTDVASGAKGRDKRPGYDAMLKACVRREHALVAVYSTDRLSRSMIELLRVLETLNDTGTALYIHTQALDTTNPSGRALFQLYGVFAELEREMIRGRVKSGLARAKGKGQRLGRPLLPSSMRVVARDALLAGASVRQAAERAGCSRGTAHAMRTELVASGELAVA
jgi:DNA invertase Pin-like site-specific DNA recombinase